MNTTLTKFRNEVKTNIINLICDRYKKENDIDTIDWDEEDVCVDSPIPDGIEVKIEGYDHITSTTYTEKRIIEYFCVFQDKSQLVLNFQDEDGEDIRPDDIDTDTLVEIHNFLKRW